MIEGKTFPPPRLSRTLAAVLSVLPIIGTSQMIKRLLWVVIDQLAKEGMRFTQFYVTGVTCNPSRTGIMTGLFPARFPNYSAAIDFIKENKDGPFYVNVWGHASSVHHSLARQGRSRTGLPYMNPGEIRGDESRLALHPLRRQEPGTVQR